MAAPQFTTWKKPSFSTTPVGVCIHEFATRIHQTERLVATATLAVANRCVFLPILPQPNTISPRKPASYMKAVIVS